MPQGFWRFFREGGETPRLLSSTDHPKRIPAGVYDKAILCAGCEPRFGAWDQHAVELLGEEPRGATVLAVGGEVVGHEIADWKPDLLKLFFISLAWRASVSTHVVFGSISLGPFEAAALRMLETSDPGTAQDFGVALAKFKASDGRIIMNPHLERFDGINFARFYLGLYVAYMKIDKRPAPGWIAPFLITPGGPLKVLARDLWRSKEAPVLRSLIAKPKNQSRTRSPR